MHRKLLPALGASAIFLATVLNAGAAPLEPASSASKFAVDEASVSQQQVVVVPTTSLLQGLHHTTAYTRLHQLIQAQGWFPGPQTFLQYRVAAYDDLGYDVGYGPIAAEQAGQLAERAFDY